MENIKNGEDKILIGEEYFYWNPSDMCLPKTTKCLYVMTYIFIVLTIVSLVTAMFFTKYSMTVAWIGLWTCVTSLVLGLTLYMCYRHSMKKFDRKMDSTCESNNCRLNEYIDILSSFFRNTTLDEVVKSINDIRFAPMLNIEEMKHYVPEITKKFHYLYPKKKTFRTIDFGIFSVTFIDYMEMDMSIIYSITIPNKNITINGTLNNDLFALWKTFYEKFGEHVLVHTNDDKDIVLVNPNISSQVTLRQDLISSMMKTDFCEYLMTHVDKDRYELQNPVSSRNGVVIFRDDDGKFNGLKTLLTLDDIEGYHEKLKSLGWDAHEHQVCISGEFILKSKEGTGLKCLLSKNLLNHKQVEFIIFDEKWAHII